MISYEDITSENLPNLLEKAKYYGQQLKQCVIDFANLPVGTTINYNCTDPRRAQIIVRGTYYYRHLKIMANLIAAKADYHNLIRIDLLFDKNENYDEKMYSRYAGKIQSGNEFYNSAEEFNELIDAIVEIADTDGEEKPISERFKEEMHKMTYL